MGNKQNNNHICINNINYNNNINIKINQNKNLINRHVNNESYKNNNKINNQNINTRKVYQYNKGKISDIKIYVNERKLNQKDNKLGHNYNMNNIIYNKNNSNIYHNFNSNNNINKIKDSYNNNVIHHIRNYHLINLNIPEEKNISVKPEEIKNNNNIIQNRNKIINKQIINSIQKTKGSNIPSQRNIKINLAKFLDDVKNKQNNRVGLGRKSLSIKRIVKENNSDFSLNQLNNKYNPKILKNSDEGNDIGDYKANIKQNINNTIQEEIKIKKSEEEKSENIYSIDINKNMIIDTNNISNITNKPNDNKISNLINELGKNNSNLNIYKNNNINYIIKNYNINSTNNNYNYYGKNKNDYSLDNITELNNNIAHNILFLKNNENINELNSKNVTDIEKQSLNYNKKFNNINQKIYTNKELSLTNKKNNNNRKKEDIINNNLFDEDNLEALPEDYDENFNDLYSIINKMTFVNVLMCVECLFTPECLIYKKYKEKFDKFYDQIYNRSGNSFSNSNNKPKKIMEGISMTSNTKTNSSSSKKNIINNLYNDLNIVKDLNIY